MTSPTVLPPLQTIDSRKRLGPAIGKLWKQAASAAVFSSKAGKSARESWRDIVSDDMDGVWELPWNVLFWTCRSASDARPAAPTVSEHTPPQASPQELPSPGFEADPAGRHVRLDPTRASGMSESLPKASMGGLMQIQRAASIFRATSFCRVSRTTGAPVQERSMCEDVGSRNREGSSTLKVWGEDGRDRVWTRRNVILQHGRLLAVSRGKGGKPGRQRELVDLRDVREIVLASTVDNATIDGASEVVFPWTLFLRLGGREVVLKLASQLPRERMLWTSAIQKLSGAMLRGDNGDLVNPSDHRRLGTDFIGSDMGSARGAGVLVNHAAFTYADNSHYAGGFDADKKLWEGYGRLKLSTGDIYEGSFKAGIRHGKGMQKYATGDVYHGTFESGLRNGNGVYYEVQGGGSAAWHRKQRQFDVYTQRRVERGQGLADTHMQLAWQFPKTLGAMDPRHDTMNRYEGDWKDDMRHGKGVLTECTVTVPRKYHVEYDTGQLKVKKPIGKNELLPRELAYVQSSMVVTAGHLLEPNTCRVYGESPFHFSIEPALPDGIYLDAETGAISGSSVRDMNRTLFTITCNNDESLREGGGDPATAHIFITVLEDGVVSGWRTKAYADGSVYTGMFQQGLWHGRGTLHLASGEVYRGSFEHGRRHGHADAEYANASYSGEFANDARQGFGRMTYATGDVYVGDWSDGNRHGMGEMTFSGLHRSVYGEWRDDVLTKEVPAESFHGMCSSDLEIEATTSVPDASGIRGIQDANSGMSEEMLAEIRSRGKDAIAFAKSTATSFGVSRLLKKSKGIAANVRAKLVAEEQEHAAENKATKTTPRRHKPTLH